MDKRQEILEKLQITLPAYLGVFYLIERGKLFHGMLFVALLGISLIYLLYVLYFFYTNGLLNKRKKKEITISIFTLIMTVVSLVQGNDFVRNILLLCLLLFAVIMSVYEFVTAKNSATGCNSPLLSSYGFLSSFLICILLVVL